MYQFSNVSPSARATWGCAAHTSEVAYVFDLIPADPVRYEPRDQVVVRAMASALAQFARIGNPNGTGLPTPFPAYRSPDFPVMDFGDEISISSKAGTPQADFFRGVFNTMRGK
jgi:para-nitrobenzyl esterase